jgi:hypothetical protein
VQQGAFDHAQGRLENLRRLANKSQVEDSEIGRVKEEILRQTTSYFKNRSWRRIKNTIPVHRTTLVNRDGFVILGVFCKYLVHKPGSVS